MTQRSHNDVISDIWGLAEDQSKLLAPSGDVSNNESSDFTSSISAENETDGDENNIILFIGDSSSGKSSLIQGFLKPTAASKDPKPTVALEYNFVRKKNTSTGKSGSSVGKIVAHMWELGGDNIHEPKLIELPLSQKQFKSSTVILCIDLSKPAQIIATSLIWIKSITDIISKRLGKTSSGSSIPSAMRNPCYKDHVDEARVNPCDIPMYILANKFDLYKGLQQGEKRLILQILRFLSHYYGATLIATSAVEPAMKEGFRNILSGINFRSNVSGNSGTSVKIAYDVNIDKPFHVTCGQDSFENILLGSKVDRESGLKSKLALSEQDMGLYIGTAGLTKDCWARLSEHLRSIFGEPVIPASLNSEDFDSSSISEYPEPDIDAMRIQRELILERYIQDKERKEATLLKMNAASKNDALSGDMDDRHEAKSSKPSNKSSRK